MTMRALCWTLAAVSIVAACTSGRASDWTPLVIPDRHAMAAGFVFDLGDTDQREPRVWQGPIAITDPKGWTCRASEDVELVAGLLTIWQCRFLYVDTYSGNANRVFVVDIRTCRTAWASPVYYGPPAVLGESHLRLPGLRPWRIGPDGLPTRRPTK